MLTVLLPVPLWTSSAGVFSLHPITSQIYVRSLCRCGAFTLEESDELIANGCLNGLFVLGRSIGFIGHFLDQKRLKQGLYRHPWDDISYLNNDDMQMVDMMKILTLSLPHFFTKKQVLDGATGCLLLFLVCYNQFVSHINYLNIIVKSWALSTTRFE